MLAISLVFFMSNCTQEEPLLFFDWNQEVNRHWIGPEFWANRLQDWKVQNGRLECIAKGKDIFFRTCHLVNYRLSNADGNIQMAVKTGLLSEEYGEVSSTGFLIGAAPSLDVLGASLVQQKPGKDAGIFAGVTVTGKLFFKNMETDKVIVEKQFDKKETYHLQLEIKQREGTYSLILKSGEDVLETKGLKGPLSGNIALVSEPDVENNKGRFWFDEFNIKGKKLQATDISIGPILSAQHTLSKGTLKMTAQMMPIGENELKSVNLEIKNAETWEQVGTTDIITPGNTATFKVNDWPDTKDMPYRIVYEYVPSTGKGPKTHYYEGTVRHDPIEKDEITVAGFTGNHNVSYPGMSQGRSPFSYDFSGIWYPHNDLVERVKMHDPDVLFFSGDQIYEGASPTWMDYDNLELDYLYKWYLYCLAYRDITKDIPTISIPDDHDVYQGNLWGQGGRKVDNQNDGGYMHPAWFVKMVERTQCTNLPDPYDPTPVEQGINVYYTDMVYGGIGFAIIEDRKFKSGPWDNPFLSAGRPDHVIDPNYNYKGIDLPGKKLLGERQLEFLEHWGEDWNAHTMKMALSQTIFANIATHHGAGLDRIVADLDSNGWPQTGRNRAVDILRRSFSFHMAGDQHLGSLIQHGIDTWDDAFYSFCVPSIANFYPRAWWPEEEGKDRPEGAPKNMGKHLDGFGNPVTVYAVTNPASLTKKSTGMEPLVLHDRMPGYGIVKMKKSDRTIQIECWPRYALPGKDQQYEGWPKTISQFDNYGREAVAYLPEIIVNGVVDPVLQVINEKTNKVEYTVRMLGQRHKAKVFEIGSYTIEISEPETSKKKIIRNLKAERINEDKIIEITL